MSFYRKIPRLLRAPYEYWANLSSFALFGFGGLVFTLVSALLYPILPRRIGVCVGRRTAHYLFRFFIAYVGFWRVIRFDIKAVDALRGKKGIIIAPNHVSLIDAVFIMARLPEVACIMKAKIWDNPFLGGGARLAGFIRNDSPGNMVKLAAEELKRGVPLLVFPEGTRMEKPPLNPFKGGFALIAKRAGAPVQSVFIETDSRFLGKKWSFLKLPPNMPIHYKVRIGEVFEVGDEESTKAFIERMETYYREELKDVYGDGFKS